MPAQISPENIRRFDGKVYRKIDAVATKGEANRMKTLFKREEDTLVRITKGKFMGKTYYDVWVHTPYIERDIGKIMR